MIIILQAEIISNSFFSALSRSLLSGVNAIYYRSLCKSLQKIDRHSLGISYQGNQHIKIFKTNYLANLGERCQLSCNNWHYQSTLKIA